MPTSAATDRVGRRYQLKRQLGQGAMGTVHEAYDTVYGRTVALKLLRQEYVQQVEEMDHSLARFQNEARIGAMLIHPNIVQVLDHGWDDMQPYIVMEFAKGKTVRQMIESGMPIPVKSVCEIVAAVASALDYAHSKGVIHRDIKPDNIMIGESGDLKVMDFGVARVQDSKLTRTGTFIGTPSYVSPEQAMDIDIDRTADVWALGMTAYEMLSGHLAFSADSIPNLLHAICYKDPRPPAALARHGIPSERWHAVFDRALAKDRANRFQTAGALADSLNRELLDVDPPAQHAPAIAPMIINLPAERAPLAERGALPNVMPESFTSTIGRGVKAAAHASMQTMQTHKSAVFPVMCLLLGVILFFGWRHMRSQDQEQQRSPVMLDTPSPVELRQDEPVVSTSSAPEDKKAEQISTDSVVGPVRSPSEPAAQTSSQLHATTTIPMAAKPAVVKPGGLMIVSDFSYSLYVDNQFIKQADGSTDVELPPGRHMIRIVSTGADPKTWEWTLTLPSGIKIPLLLPSGR